MKAALGWLSSLIGGKLYLYGAIAVAILLALFGIYSAGGRAAKHAIEKKAYKGALKTHEKITEAERNAPTDPDDARDWLRSRGS